MGSSALIDRLSPDMTAGAASDSVEAILESMARM
jgi:hypothetical protein